MRTTADTATIRPYTKHDSSAVRACIVELQEFERAIDPRLRPGESIAGPYLARMHRQCRKHSGVILVADDAGHLAGFATVLARVPFEELDDPVGECALISDLVVREGFRRRGIASALLREAERRVRAAGVTELRVGVLSGNHAARSLYRRAGFAPYLETLAKRLGWPDG